jgi:hypothetical protein
MFSRPLAKKLLPLGIKSREFKSCFSMLGLYCGTVPWHGRGIQHHFRLWRYAAKPGFGQSRLCPLLQEDMPKERLCIYQTLRIPVVLLLLRPLSFVLRPRKPPPAGFESMSVLDRRRPPIFESRSGLDRRRPPIFESRSGLDRRRHRVTD